MKVHRVPFVKMNRLFTHCYRVLAGPNTYAQLNICARFILPACIYCQKNTGPCSCRWKYQTLLTLWTGLTCPTHRRFSYIIRLRFFCRAFQIFDANSIHGQRKSCVTSSRWPTWPKQNTSTVRQRQKKLQVPERTWIFRLDVPFRVPIVYYHLNTPCNKKLGFAMVAEFPWKNKLSTSGCCKTRCRTCLCRVQRFYVLYFFGIKLKSKVQQLKVHPFERQKNRFERCLNLKLIRWDWESLDQMMAEWSSIAT